MTYLRAAMVALGASSLIGGCHHASDPTSPCFVAPPEGTNQAALYRVAGPGTCDPPGDSIGGTSVTSAPISAAHFSATIRFRVRGARPNTLYYVQRAAEFAAPPPPLNSDRICQRADGLPPWTPADGFAGSPFVTFPRPYTDQGPIKTLTTDAAGDASLEFGFVSPQIPAGTLFDVAMRLVDDENAPTSELRSGCMTVAVK